MGGYIVDRTNFHQQGKYAVVGASEEAARGHRSEGRRPLDDFVAIPDCPRWEDAIARAEAYWGAGDAQSGKVEDYTRELLGDSTEADADGKDREI